MADEPAIPNESSEAGHADQAQPEPAIDTTAPPSLAEKIRHRAGLDGDGADLVDRAFAGDPPLLAINALANEGRRTAAASRRPMTRSHSARVRRQSA